MSVYVLLAGAAADGAANLAQWLASPNPIIALGLLSSIEAASHAARAYLASPRLVSYLAGEPSDLAPMRMVEVPVGAIHDERQQRTIADLHTALARDPRAVVVLEGAAGSGRSTATGRAAGVDVIVLDLAKVAPEALAAALVSLRREALLRAALPVLANADHMIAEDASQRSRVVGDFIDILDGRLVVTVTVPGAELATIRPLLRLAWPVADVPTRVALWHKASRDAGILTVPDLDQLAHRYRVGPAAIQRAVASARMISPEGAILDSAALAAGLRNNIAERLGGLARRIEVNQTWDDLILADDTSDQIAALVGRIRHAHQVLDRWGYRRRIARGAGVAALFSGPPGTGKTMVAGLVARELDLELYQVDLSKVVSKWVGETEKNLATIFDAAEEGHALLLFDEADALFGQRSTEMRGAVDRYANLEVNYLLQRVEAFGGITVLTTNLETAIDTALKRRLAAHVVFAPPDEDERERLWVLQTRTGDAPLARDVDAETLARSFSTMTGASIRNAAIAAAFLAAGDGATEISQDHLIRAARAEYRSMGHMVSEVTSPHAGRRRV